ncbi:MAG: mechanosensitive ion channel family protein [Planctomycetota bacterium]
MLVVGAAITAPAQPPAADVDPPVAGPVEVPRREGAALEAGGRAAEAGVAAAKDDGAERAGPGEPTQTEKAETEPKPDDKDLLADAKSLLDSLDLESVWLRNDTIDWVILLGAIAAGLIAGRVVSFALRAAGQRLEQRGWRMRAVVLGGLAEPAAIALLTLGFTIGSAGLVMSPGMELLRQKTLLLIYSLAVFWYLYNLIEVVDVALRRKILPTRSLLDQQVAPLVRKTLRVVLVVLAVLFTVDSVFDQDIGAWLAGLGIAGLAVSLAAQDTLKNLFGSITILLDQPFRVGERIVCSGFDGTVEDIGMRSTKVRTLTGNLVTIPNGNIVNSPVENIGRRPFIQRVCNIGLTYDTPPDKVLRAVEIVREILASEELRGPIHPVINGDVFQPRAYFNSLNADSLNIFVIYWYAPPEWWPYMEHAERLNMQIIERFSAEGIEIAFPTRTLYLAGDPNRPLDLHIEHQSVVNKDAARPT